MKGIRVTLPVSLADWPRVPPDGFPGIPQSVRPLSVFFLIADKEPGAMGHFVHRSIFLDRSR